MNIYFLDKKIFLKMRYTFFTFSFIFFYVKKVFLVKWFFHYKTFFPNKNIFSANNVYFIKKQIFFQKKIFFFNLVLQQMNNHTRMEKMEDD